MPSSEGLDGEDTYSCFDKECGFVGPVEVIDAASVVVAFWVGYVVADEDEGFVAFALPGHAAGVVEDEFVAFWGVAAIGGGGVCDEFGDCSFVVGEVEAGDAVVVVAVVSMGYNADSDVWDEAEEFLDGFFDVSADLG